MISCYPPAFKLTIMPGVQIKTLDKTWNKNEWKTSPWMLCDSSVFDLSSCWTFSPTLCEHWTLMQAAVNWEVKHWIQQCALHSLQFKYKKSMKPDYEKYILWTNTANCFWEILQEELKMSPACAMMTHNAMQFKCSKCRNHSSFASLCPLPELPKNSLL